MLLGASSLVSSPSALSMAVPTRSVATTAGTPKTIFCSSTAPTNDSSELACRRDKSCCDSSAHSSPHAHFKKPNLTEELGRVESPVRREAWRHYSPSCPHPFRPFCLCPPLCCIFQAHTPASRNACRQPCLYHPVCRSCDHIATYKFGSLHDILPNFGLLLACLTRALLLRCMLYYRVPNPIQRKLCHVSVREDARLPLILAPKMRPIHFGVSCTFVQPHRNADPTKNTIQGIINTVRLTGSFHFEHVAIT
jgi:hypothetical protein